MDMVHRVGGPEGHLGQQEATSDDKGSWDCRNIADSGVYNSNSARLDGAMSGAHHDSKRVKMDPLGDVKASQHQHYKRQEKYKSLILKGALVSC